MKKRLARIPLDLREKKSEKRAKKEALVRKARILHTAGAKGEGDMELTFDH